MRVKWRQIVSYPKRFTAWLAVARWSILALIVNGYAIVFAWYWPEYCGHEDDVRIVAVLLQLLGWLGVFWGVLKTRSQFGLVGIGPTILKWVRQMPVLFPRPRKISLDATLEAVGVAGAGYVTTKIQDDQPVDVQLKQIRSAIEELRKSNVSRDELIRSNHAFVQTEINKERKIRQDEVNEVRRTLTSHATDGIQMTLAGAVCFLVGGILGTLPYGLF